MGANNLFLIIGFVLILLAIVLSTIVWKKDKNNVLVFSDHQLTKEEKLFPKGTMIATKITDDLDDLLEAKTLIDYYNKSTIVIVGTTAGVRILRKYCRKKGIETSR